jgi:hypothetical protein
MIKSMATTSMQVDSVFRDELAVIAERDDKGVSLGEAVRRLVGEHQIDCIVLQHHVRIDSPESGLNRPGWVRTEEITTVSTDRFARTEPLGTVSAAEMAKLRDWLREMVAFC